MLGQPSKRKSMFVNSQKMLCSHFVFLKLSNSHYDVALSYSVSTIQSTNDNTRQFFFPSTSKFHFISKRKYLVWIQIWILNNFHHLNRLITIIHLVPIHQYGKILHLNFKHEGIIKVKTLCFIITHIDFYLYRSVSNIQSSNASTWRFVFLDFEYLF